MDSATGSSSIGGNMSCNCYVRHLDEETQYVLHFGAHNPACPQYRVSLDPVDRKHDEEFRAGR